MTPGGRLVYLPQDLIVCLVRLYVVMESGRATPEIVDGMRIIKEAGGRAAALSDNDTALKHQLMAMYAHVDQLMLTETRKHSDLANLVTTVLLFLVTDDPHEGLRL